MEGQLEEDGHPGLQECVHHAQRREHSSNYDDIQGWRLITLFYMFGLKKERDVFSFPLSEEGAEGKDPGQVWSKKRHFLDNAFKF